MPSTSTRSNPGGFKPGFDPRRHVHSATCGHQLYRFTPEDCSDGFFAAIASYVERGGRPENFLRNKFRARGQEFTPRGRGRAR